VVVTTSRGYADNRAIAEYALAGLLHFAKSLDQAVRDAGGRQFNAAAYRAVGLAGKTVCVLGAGGIGREVGRLCAALDMQVLGIRSGPNGAEPLPDEWGFSKIAGPGSLIDWAPEIDFLVVACQWTPATTHLVNAGLLEALKPGAVLVNIARGEIINETDLLAALDSGRLRGAVLDVYTGEFESAPPTRLWSHPKVLLTPHTSAATDRPSNHSIDVFVANLRRYLDGRPMENVIDWERGY
jgi:phosphoglycerate dehydrogenase-like enzyme